MIEKLRSILHCLFESTLENRVKPVVDGTAVNALIVITHYRNIL